MDFRKNAKHLMCDLTTKWILESAQSLACALNIGITFYSKRSQSSGERRTHSKNERKLRRSAGSGFAHR